jgi:hypothetical protein
VNAVALDSDARIPLVSENVQPLPKDEAQGLLPSLSDSGEYVYLLTSSVTLQTPGCFQIEATVTHSSKKTLLYTGRAIVPAE